MKRFILFTLLMIPILLYFGCSDEEDKPIGYHLVESSGELKQVTIDSPVKDTYYHSEEYYKSESRSNGHSPYLYVGHWEGIEARSILQFEISSSLKDTARYDVLKEIGDATLTLYRSKEIGEENIQISFHKMVSPWNEPDVSWENATEDEVWDTPGGDYEVEPFLVVDFETTSTDSVDTLSVTLPDSLIMEWIDAYHDTLNHHNYGIMMKADGATTIKAFNSKEGLDYLPELTMDYYYQSGDEINHSTDETFCLKDPEGGQDAFIVNKDFEPPTGEEPYIEIRNGFFQRGLMQFELPDDIPQEATINYAELELCIVPQEDSTFINASSISLQTYALETSWEEDEHIKEDLESYRLENKTIYTIVDKGDSTATINISPWAQFWINYANENNGLVLRSGSENLNFSSFRIYTSEAEEKYRPTLKITYSLPPNFEW